MTARTSFGRYQIMAYVVGVMLIVVFIGLIPAINSMDAVVGPIHGALYIVYLVTVLQVWRDHRLPLWTVAAMVTAGWVPFVAFAVERWVAKRVAAGSAAAPAVD